MCGICGKININQEPVSKDLIKRMTSCLSHRGPDDEGIYIKGNVGLGHRRLSIIDLSPLARQPMSNENGDIWIVYNGEIYNFPELKEDLVRKGHVFRSKSDTETIVHLYEEYGIDCLGYLRGMFAFGIWDARDGSLFLARDRVGKKPLYYFHAQDTFVFASEIKSILQDERYLRKPDLIAIHHYLTYQSVPSPWSAFEGIKKLPPAHYLMLRNGKAEIKRYWRLSYRPKHALNETAIQDELREKIREAIRIRLISDVPLGAFLSGGMDSSIVVALMSEVMSEPVKTFSIGFYEEAYDELIYARIIAERFGTKHTEFKVKPDAVSMLPKLVWHYNEPFADPSAIPSYYVSKLAREHVTVILNGDGGDESFAGYDRYRANELAMHLEKMPYFLRKRMLPWLAGILPFSPSPQGFSWQFKQFSRTLTLSPELRNVIWMCYFNNEMKEELYTESFKEALSGTDSFSVILNKYAEADAGDFTDRTLSADVSLYLADTLLVKMDIASMSNSLEARSPFLDHQLMEFAARIPAHLKLHRGMTKIILKKAFKDILPKEIINRKKMGFGVPLDHWFRNELKEMAYDMLLDSRSIDRGYFKKGYIKRMLDEHVSGKWNWHYQIYSLLMLELWHRTFMDDNSGFEAHNLS